MSKEDLITKIKGNAMLLISLILMKKKDPHSIEAGIWVEKAFGDLKSENIEELNNILTNIERLISILRNEKK